MSIPTSPIPPSVAMSRSPIFITGRNNAQTNDSLDEMSIALAIYTGVQTPVAGQTTYNLAKDYSINKTINFEVSDLVRERFLHPFGKAFITAPSASEVGEALWVRRTGSWTYSDNGAAPVSAPIGTAYFLALEGYKSLGEQQNSGVTQSGLATQRVKQVLQSNYESLGALYSPESKLNGLLYTINGAEYFYVLRDVLGYPNTNTNSANRVIYVPAGAKNVEAFTGVLPNGEYSVSLVSDSAAVNYKARVEADGGTCEALSCLRAALAGLGYEENQETYDYEVVCEPKYEPYQVQFVNKYGVSDYITFFKKSTEQGTFTDSQYQKSIYADAFTNVNYATGKYQSYNVNSRNTLTLNTGFVDDSYAEVIEEILMSEKVAIYEDGQWVAVVPNRGSVDYQKSINDKTINYTMSFTYAFDQRMLVR